MDLRRAGYRFVGMSCYLEFPAGFDRHALDYETVCEAWCHCFRAPERFIRTPMPRALISDSDFTDYRRISRHTVEASGDYDLVYVGAVERWKLEAKNWTLAARCVPRLCRELGLRALVIGSADEEFPASEGVTFREHVPWHELLAHLAGARFLLAPNSRDPSPRVIAEALCLDVPILVNREILGGWKYVNRFTGAFFEGEYDVTAAAIVATRNRLSPSEWFRANHGPYLAGRRLLALIRSIDPSVAERSHLRLSDVDAAWAPVMSR